MIKKLFFALVLALTVGAVIPVNAQSIPSIPAQNRSNRNSSGTYESNGVVYGTSFDWLSQRYCTYSDISGLDSGQIRVLKNSVYARHGYIFKDARLKRYFTSLGWYRPRKKTVSASEMNRYEQANVVFLKKYE